MAGLVRAGKVRYWGLSNTPAWYVAKLATLAAVRGLPGPIALQYFYALVNREVEDEHVPLAAEFGMGMVPWSPLAYGLLTGKYDRATVEAAGPRAGGLPKDKAQAGEARPADDKRLDGANPFGDSLFTPRNWDIVEAVRRVNDTNYAAQAADTFVALVALTAPRTITLPAASGYPLGQPLWVADETGACSIDKPIIVAAAGGDTLAGQPNVSLQSPFQKAAFHSNGANLWTF